MIKDFDFKNFEQLSRKKELEEIIKDYDWKTFESIVANIFEKNGFKVKTNFRFKVSRRYEIDVFAVSGLYAFSVDCKEWGRGREKTFGLKNAANMQEVRTEELKKYFKANPIARHMMKLSGKQEFFSLIVTWHEENLINQGKTLIVPVWKLNSFIGNFENYC